MNSIWRKALIVLAVGVSLLLLLTIHQLPGFNKLSTSRSLLNRMLRVKHGGNTPWWLYFPPRDTPPSLSHINRSVDTSAEHTYPLRDADLSKDEWTVLAVMTTSRDSSLNVSRTPTAVYQPQQLTSIVSPTTPRQRLKSYMLALHTAEQLTMSTYHFIEFLNMVYQWNFTGVEPFVYRSRMFALRSMHQNDINGSVHYHKLMNTSFMREKLSECLQRSDKDGQNNVTTELFVPVKEFLSESQRNVTLVYFSKHMNVVNKRVHADTDIKLHNTAEEPILECTRILRESGLSRTVEGLLNQELLIENGSVIDNFTVVQSFCIMPSVKLSLIDIKKYVLGHIHCDKSDAVDVSVIFVSWQGRFTRPFTDIGTVHHCDLPANKIPPSAEVVSATDQFLHSRRLQRSSYISVHIRFEKLFDHVYRQNNPRQLLQCCMFKLDAVLRRMKEQYNLTSDSSTLLLHDYGHYGTDVCRHDGRWTSRDVCVEDVHNLLSLLNETEAVEFDPVKFNVPYNSGFVSRVEGLSLNGGRFLVVIGGGSYQTSIVNRFLEGHSSKRSKLDGAKRQKETVVYRLCAKVDEKYPGVDFDKIKECTVLV